MVAVNHELIDRAGDVLSVHPKVYWILGGVGSGKSTICPELSRMLTIPVYDMDEHICGAYFARYRAERHPANTAWAAAEYLDLFSGELAQMDPGHRLLVDGGLYHPELLSRVMPRERIVSLAAPHLDSTAVWTGTDERLAMKEMIGHLRDPERAWRTFLEFDTNMTGTIWNQAVALGSPVVSRSPSDRVDVVAARVAAALGLERTTDESAAEE